MFGIGCEGKRKGRGRDRRGEGIGRGFGITETSEREGVRDRPDRTREGRVFFLESKDGV